jgi:hypothetical protein
VERVAADDSLRRNKFLCGLVERFDHDAINRAALDVLGYPAILVETHVEAMDILKHLEGTNDGTTA